MFHSEFTDHIYVGDCALVKMMRIHSQYKSYSPSNPVDEPMKIVTFYHGNKHVSAIDAYCLHHGISHAGRKKYLLKYLQSTGKRKDVWETPIGDIAFIYIHPPVATEWVSQALTVPIGPSAQVPQISPSAAKYWSHGLDE